MVILFIESVATQEYDKIEKFGVVIDIESETGRQMYAFEASGNPILWHENKL